MSWGVQFSFCHLLTIHHQLQTTGALCSGWVVSLGKFIFVDSTTRSTWVKMWKLLGVNERGVCWSILDIDHRHRTEELKYGSVGGGPSAIQIQSHSYGCYQQITINYYYLSDWKLPSNLGRKPPIVWESCLTFSIQASSDS